MTKDDDHNNDNDREAHPDNPVAHARPAQIPLLDDVVFNTELPFPKPKSRPRAKPLLDENVPRATDLFGGSAETAQSGPLSRHYEAKDVDAAARQARAHTDRVVDHLVAEYSHEIVERLRDELTAVLQDLKPDLTPDLTPDLIQEPTNKPD